MRNNLLLFLLLSGTLFAQTNVKKCEEKFNASIIKAAKKVSIMYEQKVEDAVASGNQNEAEQLMRDLQSHKQKVRDIVKSARYNPKDLPETKPTPETTNFDGNKIIQFKDKALENFIREYLEFGDRPIKISDVRQIEELEVPSYANETVKNISGLKYFASLKKLHLRGQEINNISALKNLKKLKEVDLANNRILDISPLSELPQLINLCLDNNSIRSIKDLRKLPELSSLSVMGCKISDLTPLQYIPKLRIFHITDVNFFDISILNRCENLIVFSAGPCKKISIKSSVKQAGKRIKTMFLSDVKSLSTEFLEEFIELERLSLFNCNLESIDFLKKHKKITYLSLSNNSLKDLSVLKIMYENGCFQNPKGRNNIIELEGNKLNLKVGTKNREIVEFLFFEGVEVKFREGNRY